MTAQDLMIFAQAAVLLLTALGWTAAQRGKRAAVRVRDYRALQHRYLVALRLIYRHEQDRARRGLPRIPRPRELDDPDQDGPPDGDHEPAPASA